MIANYRPGVLTVMLGVLAITSAAGQDSGEQVMEGVRVISSDTRQLLLEITPEIGTSRLSGGEIIPMIPMAVLANPDRPGEPMRMILPVPVALPAPEGSYLEVLAVEYAPPVSGRIAPVPSLLHDARGVAIPDYRVDDIAYGRPLALPPVAELRYRGIARDLHIGHIAIAPYEFNPLTNTIRFVRSIRLRLRYAPAVAGSRPGVPMAGGAFVNGGMAGGWRLGNGETRGFQRRSQQTAARAWMRLEVKEDGLYMLTAEDFERGGIDLESVDPNRIAIYGGDGGPLDETNFMLDSGMHRVPVIVEQEGGRPARVFFFGAGPHRWSVQPGDSLPMYRLNPFVASNSYIVAVDGEPGREFAKGGTQGVPAVVMTTGIARLHAEEDQYNALDVRNNGGSGRDWFGMQFQVEPSRRSDTRAFSLDLPELVRSSDVIYRVRCAHSASHPELNATGTFDIALSSRDLGRFSLQPVGKELMARATMATYVAGGGDIPGDNRSMLKITYSNNVAASGYLDWYTVHYTRRLRAEGDRLFFEAAPGSGLARFQAEGFSTGDLFGFDITDRADPLRLDLHVEGERASFTDRLGDTRNSRRYMIVARNAARRVENISKATPGGLRDRMLNTDILVITHPDLTDIARNYCDYRSGRGMSAAYVTTDQIYTEFSSGNLDPTAIRNYLAQAFHRWTHPPAYVLLLGDGHYDYRGIAFEQKQFVPPYETDDGDEYHHVMSSSFDDYYVRLTTDAANAIDKPCDMAIGRFPVESVEQGEVILAKIRRYEEGGTYGLWRQTIGLVADDDDPVDEGRGFTRHSEGATGWLPAWLEPKKIYLAAYPMDQSDIRRSPTAEADLVRLIEQGAVITNWVGHGNPNVWAHELVLEKDKFITRLRNDSMLTYIPAVTCNFGYFDDPSVISGGELFLLHPHGGAIGVMTATRAVYIEPNRALMTQHMRSLFVRDRNTGRFPTLGEALLATKYAAGSSYDNDEKFMLLGDPALRLNLPKDSVHITKINATNVDTDVAVVGALMEVTIEGEVRDPLGKALSGFDGRLILSLYDADRPSRIESKIRSGKTVDTFDVLYHGGRLFRGSTEVRGGRFAITFRVPKDIAHDSSRGRVHAYAFNAQGDAAGMTRNVIVYGADDSPVTDHQGPDITVFVDDRSFRSGDLVTPEPMLIVDLNDPSGINSSGSSIGHRIEAWIDGDPKSVDLTDTYQTSQESYRSGTAQRRLLDLEPGEHHVRVRGWDIYNNPTEASAYFRIAAGDAGELHVTDVVNYPNPMSHDTYFLFRHNQARPLDVEITIFTTSGRKLRRLDSRGLTDRFVRVPWDGTDADGHKLANGVYLYRLRVRPAGDEEGEMYETIQTVAVVR